MATNDRQTALGNELGQAIDDLRRALQGAMDAMATLETLLPRVAAISAVFEDLESVIRAGREQIGASAGAPSPAARSFTRPTLVVPPAGARPWDQPVAAEDIAEAARDAGIPSAETHAPADDTGLVCFRLEFESKPGPLDLRMVDDAVSEHPAVRDVALLDYDGRRATLKVWIESDVSPSEVQEALKERAQELFSPDNDVTVVALEGAA